MRFEPRLSCSNKMSTENLSSMHKEHEQDGATQLFAEPSENMQCTVDTQNTTSYSHGDMTDQVAAETLVRFRDQMPQGQQMINTQCASTGFWQQGSNSNSNDYVQQLPQNPQEATSLLQPPLVYSEPNLHSTVFGLSRAITSLQQKQENITGALQNVVSILQEIRTKPGSDKPDGFNGLHARGTSSSGIPHGRQEVVPDYSYSASIDQSQKGSTNCRNPSEQGSITNHSSTIENGTSIDRNPEINRGYTSYNHTTESGTTNYRNPTYERGSTSYRPATGMGATNFRNPTELRDSTNYMPATGMGTTIYRNPTEEKDSTYYMQAAGMGTTNYQNSTEERDRNNYMPATGTDTNYQTATEAGNTNCMPLTDRGTTNYRISTEDRGITNYQTSTDRHSLYNYPSSIEARTSALYLASIGDNGSVSHSNLKEGTSNCQRTERYGSTGERSRWDFSTHRQRDRESCQQGQIIPFTSNTDRSYSSQRAPVQNYGVIHDDANRIFLYDQDKTNYSEQDKMLHGGSRFKTYPRINSFNENRRQQYRTNYDMKLPSFDGKEDWKVWVSRFEAVAERRQWDDDTKLDNLLPKLQGRAGDFVFTQLPKQTLECYSELVKELNSRFRVVETKRTFAAKFSQRVQRPNETVEEYAADLKRLYSKAHQSRDARTRQEDLVRRFLGGLRDNDARFEIEYNKEPEDIDEAVYHAVNFLQTRRRSNPDAFADKKFKKFARRATDEIVYDSDGEEYQEDVTDIDHVYRIPAKSEKPAVKKQVKQEQKSENVDNVKSGSDDSQKLLAETKNLMQNLVTQIENIAQNNQGKQTIQPPRFSQQRRGIVCYGCHEQGHISRDCPKRVGKAPQKPEQIITSERDKNKAGCSGTGNYSNSPLN